MKLLQLFRIDYRSLALFRVLLGVLLLIDLIIRFQHLQVFYANSGVLPNEYIYNVTEYFQPSVLLAFEGLLPVYFFFTFALLVYLCFILGIYTRVTTFALWIVTFSLINRNPFVLSSGYSILYLLIFWSMFLPLGRYYSVDARFRDQDEEQDSFSFYSIRTFAILFQILLIYFAAACLKLNSNWLSGNAIGVVMQADHFLTAGGYFFKKLTFLHKPFTYLTLSWEFVGPVLVLWPFKTKTIRILAVALFMLMHLSFMLTINLDLFPWICIIAWILFIPGEFWNAKRIANSKIVLRSSNIFSLVISCSATKLKFLYNSSKIQFSSSFKKAIYNLNNLLVLILISLILFWNIRNIVSYEYHFSKSTFNSIIRSVGLGQYWGMFSYPFQDDGWMIVPGLLADGTTLDVFQNQPVSYQKPERISKYYPNNHWAAYFLEIWYKKNAYLREPLVSYICKQWNSTHSSEKQLQAVKLYYQWEMTNPDTSTEKPQSILLWSGKCTNTQQVNSQNTLLFLNY